MTTTEKDATSLFLEYAQKSLDDLHHATFRIDRLMERVRSIEDADPGDLQALADVLSNVAFYLSNTVRDVEANLERKIA